jgi:PKD repeat protein
VLPVTLLVEWTFDDRTISDEQNPVHTFRRPGWYAVTLDTTDAAAARIARI